MSLLGVRLSHPISLSTFQSELSLNVSPLSNLNLDPIQTHTHTNFKKTAHSKCLTVTVGGFEINDTDVIKNERHTDDSVLVTNSDIQFRRSSHHEQIRSLSLSVYKTQK